MTTVEVFAPAKINLTLHVTGQRADGYHLLDSLVAFADIGDRITLRASGPTTLAVTGPEASPDLAGDDNIMWLTCARFWTPDTPLSLVLDKHLPIASGIGGGSADAAATYRGLLFLRAAVEGRDEPRDPTLEDAYELMRIGADVPMCVLSDPARIRGIGEQIEPIPDFPALPIVLVNPRTHVSTPAVFKRLATKENAAMEPWPERFDDVTTLIEWLGSQRNDLQAAAIADCPAIADVLEALRGDERCLFARMSGSGATCFGLYDDPETARAAAEQISAAHPNWWVRAGKLNGGEMAEPQLIRSTT